MKEEFLHFIWRFSYYNSPILKTTLGEEIHVHKVGFWNQDAGPDFIEGLIDIDNVLLAGSIELHLKSGDWFVHKHEVNRAYDNVVLHVVWEDDGKGPDVPTLELKKYVDLSLIHSYSKLVESENQIPCANQLSTVSSLTVTDMLESTLIERLERKSKEVLHIYNESHDWSEVTYRVLMKYMGFKVNNEVLFALSQALPLKVLLKHRDHLFQLEALIFGQSGLLVPVDDYSIQLKKEYDFLAAKYGLKEKQLFKSQWKFLRLRPLNFPTIRLAQLAMMIHNFGDFSLKFLATKSVRGIKTLFSFGVSEYWEEHYNFGVQWATAINGVMSDASFDRLFTNVAIPLKVALATHTDNENAKMESVELLSTIRQENNSKVKLMTTVGFENETSANTQALLQLHDKYCIEKQCLQCKIGVSILRQ